MSITRATATAGRPSFRSLVFALEPRFSTGSWINSGSYDGTPRTRCSKKPAARLDSRSYFNCRRWARSASRRSSQKLIAKGIRPELARLTLARKIAAVALAVWKKGDEFVELKLGSLSIPRLRVLSIDAVALTCALRVCLRAVNFFSNSSISA